MHEHDTSKLLPIRKRYSLMATLSLMAIFLLIFTGSLRNYVDTYPPAERIAIFDQVYDAIKPMPTLLHRYLGFLLAFLLPASALPLFATAKHSLLRSRSLRVVATALLLLGLASVIFGLITGHLAGAQSANAATENVDPSKAPQEGMLETHFNLVSLSLGFVTILLLYGALLIHRETKTALASKETLEKKL